MKTFALIAYFVLHGQPQAFVLDYGLTIEDCGQEIVGQPVSYDDLDGKRHAFPVATSFACEVQQ